MKKLSRSKSHRDPQRAILTTLLGRHIAVGCAAVVAVGGLALQSPVQASGRVSFNPSVSAGFGYSDNLANTADNRNSDVATVLGVSLPVSFKRDHGSTNLGFNARYPIQNDETALSRFGFGASLGFAQKPNTYTDYGLKFAFNRTQIQADPFALEDDDELFLTRRVESDTVRADFEINQDINTVWRWQGAVGFSRRENRAILDFDQAPVNEFNTAEDRDQAVAAFGINRKINARTSFGMNLRQSRFDLAESGVQDTTGLTASLGYTISEKTSIGVSVGGFRASGEAADGVASDNEQTGVQGSFSINRTLRRASVRFGLNHVPGQGGNLRGTATQSTAVLAFSGRETKYWFWNASVRYGIRDPSGPDPLAETNQVCIDDPNSVFCSIALADRTSYGATVRLERSFLKMFGMTLQTNWINQTVDGSPENDISTLNANLGVVWYPLGRIGGL